MRIPQHFISGEEISGLFDFLPMVSFYSKDRDGVFLRCNRRFEEEYGLQDGGAVGLTDYDLHPPEMAGRYRAEDRRVMETGNPLPNQTWMVPDGKGILHWWISSKTPLRDTSGRVCGISGVMYEISRAGGIMEPFARLEPALTMIHKDTSDPLNSERLAAACNLSTSQFNRVFRQLLGHSPQDYVLRHRLETAKQLLAQTELPPTEIAMRAGFYDASVLGKKFRQYEGTTPRQYRLRLRELVQLGG